MVTATTLASQYYGLSHHVWDVEPQKLTTGNKLNLMFQISFCFASTATKISLLWFCKRLLGTRPKGLYRKYNHVIIASMVAVLFLCLIFLAMTIFQCRRVPSFQLTLPRYEKKRETRFGEH